MGISENLADKAKKEKLKLIKLQEKLRILCVNMDDDDFERKALKLIQNMAATKKNISHLKFTTAFAKEHNIIMDNASQFNQENLKTEVDKNDCSQA